MGNCWMRGYHHSYFSVLSVAGCLLETILAVLLLCNRSFIFLGHGHFPIKVMGSSVSLSL